MKPHLLVIFELPPSGLAVFEDSYSVHYAPDPARWRRALAEAGDRIRAAVTTGVAGFSDEQMEALPALEIIVALGVGYENIDAAAARRRKIAVAHGEQVNGDTTADHAMALLLAGARAIPQKDRAARRGQSQHTGESDVSGQRLGIVGLGDIGTRVAHRGEGFNMPVAYHNRRERTGVAYRYERSPRELARGSDFLVLTCPGGDGTYHIIDTPVLEALGPEGILVNVARGSVVDTQALIQALKHGRIAGAALDVFEGEPEVPDALRSLENVIITPHVAGRSPTSVRAIIRAALNNLAAHFAGRPLPTPIP